MVRLCMRNVQPIPHARRTLIAPPRARIICTLAASACTRETLLTGIAPSAALHVRLGLSGCISAHVVVNVATALLEGVQQVKVVAHFMNKGVASVPVVVAKVAARVAHTRGAA